MDKARKVPRSAALKEVQKTKTVDRPVFPVVYDPRLPPITSTLTKHWRSMVSRNKYLGEVFPSPPLTAYKRQPNQKSFLVRAALPKGNRRYPQRNQKGMSKCNTQNCTACPFIREGKNIKINGAPWKINRKLDCQSYNIVYAIVCKKDTCKQVYIGETKRLLKFRLAEHRGYVVNGDTTKATGRHFSLADLQVTAIEKAKKKDIL